MCWWIPQRHLFPKPSKPNSLSLFYQSCASAPDHLGGPLMSLIGFINSVVVQGLLWTEYSSQGLTSAEWRGRIIPLYLWARLLLIQPSLLLPFIAASEHWGLMLSSAHLNPKVLLIQPVSPQPVMQNSVLIKFH